MALADYRLRRIARPLSPTIKETNPMSNDPIREALRLARDAFFLLKINSSLNAHQLAIIEEPWERLEAILATPAAEPATPERCRPTPQQISNYLSMLDRIQRRLVEDEARAIAPTPTQAAALTPAEPGASSLGETMYLVMAGGDGFSSKIVPASRLDDAYLLTQWIDLECVEADDRTEALEHFHDDDNWTHTDVTGNGERLEFSVHFEDGWVRVIRLFDTQALAAPLPAVLPSQEVAELRATAEHWMLKAHEGRRVEFIGTDPLRPTAGAAPPMIPDSWRFGFRDHDGVLRFGHMDEGPFVAWDAVAPLLHASPSTRDSASVASCEPSLLSAAEAVVKADATQSLTQQHVDFLAAQCRRVHASVAGSEPSHRVAELLAEARKLTPKFAAPRFAKGEAPSGQADDDNRGIWSRALAVEALGKGIPRA